MQETRTLAEIDADIEALQAQLADVHGTECEVYARIVGYYRSVKNWNKGKKEEYGMRAMFDPPDCSCTATVQNTSAHKDATDAADEVQMPCTTYELYFRKTCPNCPSVKSYMAKVSLDGRSIDVDTQQGLNEAAQKGVFAAPTVIFYDKSGHEAARCHNVDEITALLHAA